VEPDVRGRGVLEEAEQELGMRPDTRHFRPRGGDYSIAQAEQAA
jgi:hypothetical protein